MVFVLFNKESGLAGTASDMLKACRFAFLYAKQ
jgi:hypothetical protein